MAIISMDEVRNRVKLTIKNKKPYDVYALKKSENINNFNNLSRFGLENDVLERRLLLYKTQNNEKIYMQYPGKESSRNDSRFPNDCRPVLMKSDGTIIPDMDFKAIWDIIDTMANDHRGDLDILGAIFLRMGYMYRYKHNNEEYLFEDIDMTTNRIANTGNINLEWNSIKLDDDVIETINDRLGPINGISIEAFIYYNDLLVQNEDCKYNYLMGDGWKINQGRINTCLTHLTLISHLRGYMGLSKLISRFRTGVAPLPQSRFNEACGDLVEFVEHLEPYTID